MGLAYLFTDLSSSILYLYTRASLVASGGKESTCNEEISGSIPGSGRYPGRGNGNPLPCSCLENPIDRGAWKATVHGVANSWTWLSVWTLLNTAQQSVMGSFFLPAMVSDTYMITNPSFKFLSSCSFQLLRGACIIVLIDFTYPDIPDNFFYNASFILRF